MAKEKKRGFFSWLGLGRDEQKNDQSAQEKETLAAAEESQVVAEADAPVQPTEQAVETAELKQQADDWLPEEDALPSVDEDDEILPEDAPIVVHAVDEPQPQGVVEPDAAPERLLTPTGEVLLAEDVAPEEAPLSDAELEAAALAAAPQDAELADALADEPEPAVLADDVAEAAEPAALSNVAEPAALADDLAEEPEPVALPDAPRGEASALDAAIPAVAAQSIAAALPQEQERPTREGFFARLKRSLVKTRQNLGSGFIGLFRGKKIDDDLFDELEEQLLIADVGVETTRRIIDSLTTQANRKQLRDAEALYGLLKTEMAGILAKVDQPLDVGTKAPFVILMVGVNGVGKTTTIGKLARQYQAEGKSVMLAAGDTFRAAAVEQLQVWGERNNIPVVAQHTGADSASVIFDAIQAAKARGVDVLIADTAGRLQNKAHLMEELKKITRVMKKLDENAPHEVMLTIDASTGQNAVSQARLFHEAVGLTGITLTKLDGTAKGGVIFSVADQFGIPIRYIGVGEGIDDLRTFRADDFIEALFARED